MIREKSAESRHPTVDEIVAGEMIPFPEYLASNVTSDCFIFRVGEDGVINEIY